MSPLKWRNMYFMYWNRYDMNKSYWWNSRSPGTCNATQHNTIEKYTCVHKTFDKSAHFITWSKPLNYPEITQGLRQHFVSFSNLIISSKLSHDHHNIQYCLIQIFENMFRFFFCLLTSCAFFCRFWCPMIPSFKWNMIHWSRVHFPF